MLEMLRTYSKEAFTLAAVVLGFILNRAFRLRPKLIYGVRHSTNYIVDESLLDKDGKVLLHKQLVKTASIVAENSGLLPAKNVEFTFNWKPPIYNVWPARTFQTEIGETGSWTLKLESLAPSEAFGIEILSINQDLPLIAVVRSEDSIGKIIPMAPQRQFPTWITRALGCAALLGIATAIYISANMVEWIAQ